jgi:hypothetical protein
MSYRSQPARAAAAIADHGALWQGTAEPIESRDRHAPRHRPTHPSRQHDAAYVRLEADRCGSSISEWIAAGGAAVAGSAPARRLQRLSEIAPQGGSFLWEPYLPIGKLTLLEGDPGQGQSWLATANRWALANRQVGREKAFAFFPKSIRGGCQRRRSKTYLTQPSQFAASIADRRCALAR